MLKRHFSAPSLPFYFGRYFGLEVQVPTATPGEFILERLWGVTRVGFLLEIRCTL